MKIGDLEAFAAVVRCQSLSQAALELGLTQPAITRRIQSLEQDLGVELLDRNTKPPRLTERGLQVHEQCRAVLREVESLRLLTQAELAPAGRLRIGVTQGVADLALSGMLAAVRQRWPALVPQVSTHWAAELTGLLQRGELDAVVAFYPRGIALPAAVAGRVLTRTRLVVVGRKGDASRRTWRLADCNGRGWVLNPDGCGFRGAVRRALEDQGLRLNVTVDSHARELQLDGVAKGLGFGLMPLPLLEHSRWRGRLDIVPVADFKPQLDLWLLHQTAPGRLRVPIAQIGDRVASLMEVEHGALA